MLEGRLGAELAGAHRDPADVQQGTDIQRMNPIDEKLMIPLFARRCR